MQYEGVNNVESEAQEDQWLDVSYTARRYSDNPAPQASASRVRSRPAKFQFPGVFRNPMVQLATLLVLCVAIMIGGIFIGSEGSVMGIAKTTFLSLLDAPGKTIKETIKLPYNVSIDDIKEGVVTFSGGSIIVSFTEGSVTEVAEGTISVTLDDKTVIIYSGLTECYVTKGEEVTINQVLGQYKDTAQASIYYDGTIVVDVVGSDSTLQWGV